MRQRLRDLPVFTGPLPSFDPGSAPAEPTALFVDWLDAAMAASAKGEQLARAPRAALSFYWPVLGRQVRIRGPVHPAPPADSSQDYLARSASARAESLLGRQSQVLDPDDDVEAALAAAAARIDAEPALVADTWTLYRLAAREVEFWQAAASRRHTRLRYVRRDGGKWVRELLWP